MILCKSKQIHTFHQCALAQHMLTEKAFKESGLDSPSLSPPLPQYKRDQFTHKTGNDSQNNLTPISKWLSQIQMGNDVCINHLKHAMCITSHHLLKKQLKISRISQPTNNGRHYFSWGPSLLSAKILKMTSNR